MLSVMRLLFVKLSSIGDIVHTLPTLAAVKTAIPDINVSWVAETNSAEILRNNPLLDRLIEIDTRTLRHKAVLGKTIKTAAKQFRDLRASEFDLVIDFQGLFKSASISKLAKTRFRAGFARSNMKEPGSRHLYTHRFKVDEKINVIYKNMELAEKAIGAQTGNDSFALSRQNLQFPIHVSEKEHFEARELLSSTDRDFVILNPAGGWVTKLWPAENYGRLADKLSAELGIDSLLCTGPNESELAERAVSASSSGRLKVAQPSLKGFYQLAKSARAYVGGDTAPTHLAVAARCPVVGIFGPTEWWRNGSPDVKDVCIARDDIECRVDCHRRTCNKWICMDIPVERVLLGIRTRLGI